MKNAEQIIKQKIDAIIFNIKYIKIVVEFFYIRSQ